jgi:HD-like signal output (HDOD) protein
MIVSSTAKSRPQIDRARVLQAATSLGLIGSGADSVARLMNKLCDAQADSNEIAALIETHPILCARVLRVANSAYYGQQRAVTTIKQAVLLLGLSAVRGVAAAACVDRATSRATEADLADMPALLRHSLATAVAADTLARIKHETLAAEAFIAGLLHNLGVAVQTRLDRPGVSAIIDARRLDTTRDIRALESEHSAVCHEECVAAILDAWQLPESVVMATGYHHNPNEAPAAYRELATLVSLGAALALASGHTFSLEPAAADNQTAAEAARQLGLTADDLERIAAELPERVENLRRALS